jgi:hypothetical protein
VATGIGGDDDDDDDDEDDNDDIRELQGKLSEMLSSKHALKNTVIPQASPLQ